MLQRCMSFLGEQKTLACCVCFSFQLAASYIKRHYISLLLKLLVICQVLMIFIMRVKDYSSDAKLSTWKHRHCLYPKNVVILQFAFTTETNRLFIFLGSICLRFPFNPILYKFYRHVFGCSTRTFLLRGFSSRFNFF